MNGNQEAPERETSLDALVVSPLPFAASQAQPPGSTAHSTRVPNLLHFCLFLVLWIVSLVFVEGLVLATSSTPLLITLQNVRLQLLGQSFSYVIALAIAWYVFPLVWQRSFLSGISFNWRAASPWLIGFGLALGFVTQAVESLLPIPSNLPMDKLVHSSELIWPLVLLGTILAPIFEEITFRGFLLPAIANAVDWFQVPREPGAMALWQRSEDYSTAAIVVASIITSILFALLHAAQLAGAWAAVALLAGVSLILCLVRLRFRSVAASTLVHACYNLSVFITLFIVTSGFHHLERAG